MIQAHLRRIKSVLNNPKDSSTAHITQAQESFVRVLDFVNTTKQMRDMQDRYFKAKTETDKKSWLAASKALEKKIDDMLTQQESLL
jgi:hypothetical protein